jgi:hypothetical protein
MLPWLQGVHYLLLGIDGDVQKHADDGHQLLGRVGKVHFKDPTLKLHLVNSSVCSNRGTNHVLGNMLRTGYRAGNNGQETAISEKLRKRIGP